MYIQIVWLHLCPPCKKSWIQDIFFFFFYFVTNRKADNIKYVGHCFKRHNMVAGKKLSGRIGRVVWITWFFLCSWIFLSATILCSLKPSPFIWVFRTNIAKCWRALKLHQWFKSYDCFYWISLNGGFYLQYKNNNFHYLNKLNCVLVIFTVL